MREMQFTKRSGFNKKIDAQKEGIMNVPISMQNL